MSPDIRRTLLIDAVIAAILVALAFILAPGVAIVGIAAVLVLILAAISFAFSGVRARRRSRPRTARPQALAGRSSAYGSSREAAGRPGSVRRETEELKGPAVKRVPASRRPPARRKPLQ